MFINKCATICMIDFQTTRPGQFK